MPAPVAEDLRWGGKNRRALFWALAFTAWTVSVVVVSVVGAYSWSRRVNLLEHIEMDIRNNARDDDYPGENARGRAREAEADRVSDRFYNVPELIVCGVLGVGLAAMPFVYRRRVPLAARPTRRVWLFLVPALIVVGLALAIFSLSLAGAIKG